MKILLVYPRCPNTFWSFTYALRFISRKAGCPPLGLLTVAAMLPAEWEKRLVDMNVTALADADIAWADYVFLSAMSIQQESARSVIDRCNALGTKVVAGGPLFSARPEDFAMVDHLVLNEAELTLPPFLKDLERGQAKHRYTTGAWADMTRTPPPLWELIAFNNYATMNLQYSRGCPYDCSFCDITVLYGREPRTKTKPQMLAELQHLYRAGWRGHVFLVDDNFIGNKAKLKRDVLPALMRWMDDRHHPFTFSTEASINLADDNELLRMMVRAGFDTVFIGIESPHADSLAECGKVANRNRDLIASIRKIQQAGVEVQGGFIVGFDNDPPTIFERLATFIQESGIATAMVGLLNAPRGTKLYKRLEQEGRLLQAISGDNTDASMNFTPAMSRDALLNGYRSVLQSIYAPRHYYARVKHFLRDFQPLRQGKFRLRRERLGALVKSALVLGVIGKERLHYWKLFFWTLSRHPRLFPNAITHAIYGFHFRKVFERHLRSAL